MNPPQVYLCSPSWTLLPPPSPYHPSGSSQCTSPKHPVLCIEPGLASRFIHDILHVSMPFSQIFPPSPSPTESIRLFYTSVPQRGSVDTLLCHFGISSLTFSYWFEAISSIQNRVHKQRASLIAQLVKNPPAVRETWVLSLGRSPGKGKGYPLQYSGLENSMDCVVHGVAKS